MRLHDYLGRVGLTGDAALRPTIDTLTRLHAAHRETFLFENISIQTGGSISVALPDIEHKFLDEGRGGYCFEHNTLFAAALADLGFTATTLLGRVRRGPPERWCRTHMVLRVAIDGRDWLADTGFGGVCLYQPMPLHDGAEAFQVGLSYRLRREHGLWILSMRDAAGTTSDMYEFGEERQTAGDIEVANHFTSTHPISLFRRTLTIQRTTRSGRLILRNETLRRYRDGHPHDEPVDRARLGEVARETFGVDLPRGPFVYESLAERT